MSRPPRARWTRPRPSSARSSRVLPGYSGGLELVSADGKFLSIALFDTMENAEAAEPTFDEEMPAKLGHLFQEWEGNRVSVDRYHVAGDDRR